MKETRKRLEQFYDQHCNQLYALALAITKNTHDAEEALHNAFLRLIKRRAITKNIKVYIFQSVRNAAIDVIRKNKRSLDSSIQYLFAEPSNPRERAENSEFQRAVEEKLTMLREDERETIIQHLYADLTFQEIADIRNTSINTVMSWYRRGMEKLKTHLEPGT